MQTVTATHDFLPAILAEPERDDLRLIYADWLEESGQEERGEFVRVQCELDPLRKHGHGAAYPHEGSCDKCLRAARLERRERELLTRTGVDWLVRMGEGWRSLAGVCLHTAESRISFISPFSGSVLFRRGFVAAVSCPLPAWQQHGPTIVYAQPVTEVRVTDREPIEAVYGIKTVWFWDSSDTPGDPGSNVLPVVLIRLMVKAGVGSGLVYGRYLTGEPASMMFDSPAAANAALSSSLVTWARLPEGER